MRGGGCNLHHYGPLLTVPVETITTSPPATTTAFTPEVLLNKWTSRDKGDKEDKETALKY